MKNSIKNQKATSLSMGISKSNVFGLLLMGLLTISCGDGKKDAVVDTADVDTTEATTADGSKYAEVSSDVIDAYMDVKNALVQTNQENASKSSQELASVLKDYNLGDHASTLSPSIVSAMEHAEKMVDANIEKQREEFELLSADLLEIVNKTGTNTTLYQQFCPMYGDDGAIWLSTEEKIRNPYFGDKMMNCGSTQKEFK